MSETQSQAQGYEGYAVLELLGHRTRAGFVSEAMIAGAPFLRIDIPRGEQTITEFYAASALYGMQPCDEATVHLVADRHEAGPIDRYDLERAVRQRHGEEIESLRDKLTDAHDQLHAEREKVRRLERGAQQALGNVAVSAPATDDEDDDDGEDDGGKDIPF